MADPLTLLALAAAAGFVFNKISSQAKKNNELKQNAITYSRDIVANTKLKPLDAPDFDITTIEVLPEYVLVKALIENHFPLIFVTGGAGTGKSTLIRWLLNEFHGSALLGAPTGIAAINIGGQTLHSLCQLPPAFILEWKDIKETPWRREIKEAKLLIIDEISMVKANLLDAISAFFRLNRGIDEPFGGLPVLMIGDMFQLPPVVDKNERKLYEKYYKSAKFNHARCIQFTTFYAIELKKTFRQTDQIFVDTLNKIREGVYLDESIAFLNSQCLITSRPTKGAVWLSPRKIEVNAKNMEELKMIESPIRVYQGKKSGKFKDDRLPSPFDLELKCEAQVMFTKNDISKRWVNGTVGIIKTMSDVNIVVELSGSYRLVDVGRVTWEEYEYCWNSEISKIDRIVVGSYTQFPLILAWAITIHKSQGQTIENVHLDLGLGAFDTGQTYVALSRCRSISGLSMTRYLKEKDVLIDHDSKVFYDDLRSKIKNLPPEKMMENLETDQCTFEDELDIPF